MEDITVGPPKLDFHIPVNLPKRLPELEGYKSVAQAVPFSQLFAQLRARPGIWSILVHDLLSTRKTSIAALSRDLGVSARTVKRILSSRTKLPNFQTSFRLFSLHAEHCAHRYRTVNPQEEREHATD